MSAVHLSNLLPALLALGPGQSRDGFLSADLALGRLVVADLQQRGGGLPPVGVLVSVLRLDRKSVV